MKHQTNKHANKQTNTVLIDLCHTASSIFISCGQWVTWFQKLHKTAKHWSFTTVATSDMYHCATLSFTTVATSDTCKVTCTTAQCRSSKTVQFFVSIILLCCDFVNIFQVIRFDRLWITACVILRREWLLFFCSLIWLDWGVRMGFKRGVTLWCWKARTYKIFSGLSAIVGGVIHTLCVVYCCLLL